jgi:hypothetical protein
LESVSEGNANALLFPEAAESKATAADSFSRALPGEGGCPERALLRKCGLAIPAPLRCEGLADDSLLLLAGAAAGAAVADSGRTLQEILTVASLWA